jgi:hypothetical protein
LVPKHEAAEMLNKSREAMRYIVDHGMSTNSARICARELSDGQVCGLVEPCPDCGPRLVDVGIGAER